MAQLLSSLPFVYIEVILSKHFSYHKQNYDLSIKGISDELEEAHPDDLSQLVNELAATWSATRHEVSPKYVFDQRFEDLTKWLQLDGWRIEKDSCVTRLGPAVEDAAKIEDDLIRLLPVVGLDDDNAIKTKIAEAAQDFVSGDYNGSNTKVRIALETLVARIADKLGATPPVDGKKVWGTSLSELRKNGLIDKQAEDAFSATYTFVSDAAHKPLGIKNEEWARISRTYTLSTAYYLAKLYEHKVQPSTTRRRV